jgi:hypothetical protein
LCGDLHQIQTGLGCSFSGFVEGDDSYLFSVGVDEADGADADLIVYAGLLDGATS